MTEMTKALATSAHQIRVGMAGYSVPSTPPSAVTLTALDAPAVSVVATKVKAADAKLTVTLDKPMTPGARYRLELGGVLTPCDFVGFTPRAPNNRNFSLWAMLPKYNRREDTSGDLRRFIDCLQDIVTCVLADIDRMADAFDVERAPEASLDGILRGLGDPFSWQLDGIGKRRLAGVLTGMYQQKGTAQGIRSAIRFFLGLDVRIEHHIEADLNLDGTGLGLASKQKSSLFGFDLVFAEVLTNSVRRRVGALADYLKPVHTKLGRIREPKVSPIDDSLDVGVTDLD